MLGPGGAEEYRSSTGRYMNMETGVREDASTTNTLRYDYDNYNYKYF